ncbi:hypothetical protein D3C84_958250 [compost metagenome]
MQAQHPLHRRLVHRPVQRHAADQPTIGVNRQGHRTNQERQAHRIFPVAFGALAETLLQCLFGGAEQRFVAHPFTLGQALYLMTFQFTEAGPSHGRMKQAGMLADDLAVVRIAFT